MVAFVIVFLSLFSLLTLEFVMQVLDFLGRLHTSYLKELLKYQSIYCVSVLVYFRRFLNSCLFMHLGYVFPFWVRNYCLMTSAYSCLTRARFTACGLNNDGYIGRPFDFGACTYS